MKVNLIITMNINKALFNEAACPVLV